MAVLQCVVVCCSVIQCDAVCCSVLRCVVKISQHARVHARTRLYALYRMPSNTFYVHCKEYVLFHSKLQCVIQKLQHALVCARFSYGNGLHRMCSVYNAGLLQCIQMTFYTSFLRCLHGFHMEIDCIECVLYNAGLLRCTE